MEKVKAYLPMVTIGLLLVVFLNTCGTKSKIASLKKEVTTLQLKQDSLINNTVSKEELNLMLQIEGLKSSKRALYDQNSIIRTVERPDDRMNSYDKEIEALTKKLKK